jgi:hypothetical protein
MELIRIIDGQPTRYSLRQLKADHPNTSFPADPSLELLASYDVHPYTITARPSATDVERVVDDGFHEVNGVWLQTWRVERLPLSDAERRVREQRDDLLAQSDWVVTKAVEQNAADGLGIQVPMNWINYRQALRDIPSQAGFPYTVTWPQEP